MLGAIRHALANLANPNGRDARQTFWYWVLAVVVLRFAAGLAVSMPMTLKIMGTAVQAAKTGAAHDPAAVQAMTMQIVSSELPKMIWSSVAIGVATMLLLAMSLVRRLHDSDLPGWLVLIPGALYAGALARMPGQIDTAIAMMGTMHPGTRPDMTAMMQAQGGVALLAYVPLALVIWFGVRKSSDGPNRFGQAGAQF